VTEVSGPPAIAISLGSEEGVDYVVPAGVNFEIISLDPGGLEAQVRRVQQTNNPDIVFMGSLPAAGDSRFAGTLVDEWHGFAEALCRDAACGGAKVFVLKDLGAGQQKGNIRAESLRSPAPIGRPECSSGLRTIEFQAMVIPAVDLPVGILQYGVPAPRDCLLEGRELRPGVEVEHFVRHRPGNHVHDMYGNMRPILSHERELYLGLPGASVPCVDDGRASKREIHVTESIRHGLLDRSTCARALSCITAALLPQSSMTGEAAEVKMGPTQVDEKIPIGYEEVYRQAREACPYMADRAMRKLSHGEIVPTAWEDLWAHLACKSATWAMCKEDARQAVSHKGRLPQGNTARTTRDVCG